MKHKPGDRFWIEDVGKWFLCWISEHATYDPCGKCGDPDCGCWSWIESFCNPKNGEALVRDHVCECEMLPRPETDEVICSYCREVAGIDYDPYDPLLVVCCGECEMYRDYYCVICDIDIFSGDDDCPHVRWDEHNGDYIGCGISEPEIHEEGFLCLMALVDIAIPLRAALEKSKYKIYFRGELFGGIERAWFDILGGNIVFYEELFSPINEIEDEELRNEKVNNLLIGLSWMESLEAGGKCADDEKITIQWIDKYLNQKAMRLVI